MNINDVLTLSIIALNNSLVFQNLIMKMQAAGRTDLTPEETAEVRGLAVAAGDALQAKIDAALQK